MDAFEYLVAKHFEDQGFWTRIGYKVELSKKEKADINNPSMPRPEIDVLAFRPSTAELLIVECKSYLDSRGVGRASFDFNDQDRGGRYKLFNKKRLRDLVFQKVVEQLRNEGALGKKNVTIRLGLACGKIVAGDEDAIRELFAKQDWLLVTPSEIAKSIRDLANKGYENEIATVVVKILERGKNDPR